MSRRRVDARPVVVFAGLLVLGTLAGRLVPGVLSVVVSGGVAALVVAVTVLVRVHRGEASANAVMAEQWRQREIAAGNYPMPAGQDAGSGEGQGGA